MPLKVQEQTFGHSNPNMTLFRAEADLTERRKTTDQLDGLLLPNVAKLSQTPLRSHGQSRADGRHVKLRGLLT